MTRIALIALALAASTTAASAYDTSRYDTSRYDSGRSARIDAREAAQARRIEHGRRTGHLTWYESLRLKAEQRRIYRLERAAKRDGHISREEARRIERAQDAASRHIAREAHDDQTSWRRRWN